MSGPRQVEVLDGEIRVIRIAARLEGVVVGTEEVPPK